MKNDRGYAALIIVFVIGLVGLFLSLSLINSGFVESMSGRNAVGSDKALFAAQSAVEEALMRIKNDKNYSGSSTIFVDGAIATVSAFGSSSSKTIAATASAGTYVRRVKAVIQNNSITPQFLYGLQSGVNGIELSQNTSIASSSGNVTVYSNGFIAGEANDRQGANCKNIASVIQGNAYAVTSFDRTIGGTGVCVSNDAYAATYSYCYVFGKRRVAAGGNCLGGTFVATPAPTSAPLPAIDVSLLKGYLQSKGITYSGNCSVDGASACSGGFAKTIGNEIITGNLTIPQNTNLTVTGPVWVQGTIFVDSNVNIGLTGPLGKIVLTDQTITLKNNISSTPVGNAFLLFITTYTSYPSPSPTPVPAPGNAFCSTPAVQIGPATSNLLFYAMNGCISLSNNATFNGAIVGEKIFIDHNSTVTYNAGLSSAVFAISQTGGWQTNSFTEY